MAEDTAGCIRLDRSGGVATVTVDRPEKKNALTKEMFERLADVLVDVAHETGDRVLVVRGTRDSFSSGADLLSSGGSSITGFGPLDGTQWMREINRAARALHDVPKPTIGALNGVAAGAGANLALGCDIVIAAESARLSQIFVRRGLGLDFGGTWLLPRLVGLQRAKDLAFRGEFVSAKEAAEIGLVLRAVPDAELDAVVDEYARTLAALPPVPLMQMKHGLDHATAWTMEEALDYEARSQAVCFQTADLQEALLAWVNKREPRYQGR